MMQFAKGSLLFSGMNLDAFFFLKKKKIAKVYGVILRFSVTARATIGICVNGVVIFILQNSR